MTTILATTSRHAILLELNHHKKLVHSDNRVILSAQQNTVSRIFSPFVRHRTHAE